MRPVEYFMGFQFLGENGHKNRNQMNTKGHTSSIQSFDVVRDKVNRNLFKRHV